MNHYYVSTKKHRQIFYQIATRLDYMNAPNARKECITMRLLKLCKPRAKIIQSYGEDIKIAYMRSAKGVIIDGLVELDLEAMIEVQRFIVKSIRYAQEVKRCEELREARKRPLICNQDLTALNIKLD